VVRYLHSNKIISSLFSLLLMSGCSSNNEQQQIYLNPDHSVARYWNEATLKAIRKDFARPTVHARNLFHTSVAMYDAWAVYDSQAKTYLSGNTLNNFHCPLNSPIPQSNIEQSRDETLSYAVYKVLQHRFKNSPGATQSLNYFDQLMLSLGYQTLGYQTLDYQPPGDQTLSSVNEGELNDAALLGLAIADCVIEYGLQDGANEANAYATQFYSPVNPALNPETTGNPDIIDLNRWQPLAFEDFIDQSNNSLGAITAEFVGPEWGQVKGFALSTTDSKVYQRDSFNYRVYHDPGSPPYLDTHNTSSESDEYKWGFSVVLAWAAQLDPADGVMWDISPAAIGNNQQLPLSRAEYASFYDRENGGDWSTGHSINPYTGLAYEPQIVPRADFARVLAEFWADGPDSETPPGHWFVLLNDINDHPALEKRMAGQGSLLSNLEWDIKTYFTLGGAMHDAAISAWGIKGWYDYIRPISAIRGMAELGQSSDPAELSYHPGGLPLIPGLIEVVQAGDPLAGINNLNVGRLKVYSWRGPSFISDPSTDIAGTGWIFAENWWPYQRPSFVTPPFAGYVSGHSTFSRAAAEVLTLLTGDEYFPGGLGEYPIEKNNFLVFESGPSVDMRLQWASYRDASDQSSLSRIWGGIHPPADDIPGRVIGERVGIDAFNFASQFF